MPVRSRESKKAKKNRGKRKQNNRTVIPLEYWSCLDKHGCISMIVRVEYPNYYGAFTVLLCVCGSDDSGFTRWFTFANEDLALEAYERITDLVTRAPNPLPFSWIKLNGLKPW